MKEVYSGFVDLKYPAQIPVKAFKDSKSLWESIHNSRQCEEKLLRNTIAALKESLEKGFVESIEWVPTKSQLADCLTKKGVKADWLLKLGANNKLE